MLGIGPDREQGLGGSLEQEIVDERFVLVSDVADGPRHGEHDVKVRHRQEFCFARGEPSLGHRALALRAVPVATGVVGDLGVVTRFAARDVAPERRGAAALDRRHDLQSPKA